MNDWKAEIVKGVLIHQRLQELDTAGIWSYPLPEVAATDADILAVEHRLGFRIDEQYREFLLHANGWRAFYQDVDLLGTATLLDGPLIRVANEQLQAVDPSDFRDDVGVGVDDLLPIAASRQQSDIFLLGLPGSPIPGTVIWFAGYTIERFRDFDEFYLSMLDYNRLEIIDFEQSLEARA